MIWHDGTEKSRAPGQPQARHGAVRRARAVNTIKKCPLRLEWKLVRFDFELILIHRLDKAAGGFQA